MDSNEVVIFLLYIVAIVLSLYMFQTWAFGTAILVILLIILSLKVYSDKKIQRLDESRKMLIDKVSENLEKFSSSLGSMANDIGKSFYAIERKIEEEKIITETKLERNYNDIARKVIELENRINEVKRWLGKE